MDSYSYPRRWRCFRRAAEPTTRVISRASAIQAAKTYVVREDYRRDEPLFYRNTGNRPAAVRRTRDANGRRAWFVRFDDCQAMHKHCVMVRRVSAHVLTRRTAC